MVNCLKPYIVVFLSPLPTAPTAFLILFLLSLTLTHTPCPYCSLLVIMFLNVTCAFSGCGTDYSVLSATRCWVDSRSREWWFNSRLSGTVWRPPGLNASDHFAAMGIPDIVIQS
ncbi:hypothetical protein BC830DRAFT_1172667 [Chytriomyces sp. MP71]|nr:hypothetical protein BC830DRAFT_1172667 [Chytriomyces sp. MP71]